MFLALGALPPLRWGQRIAGLIALLLVLGAFCLPTPYDAGWGYELLRLAATSAIGAALAGVAVRGAIALAIMPSTPSPTEAALLAGFDALLLAGLGVVVGCAMFLVLAMMLQGGLGGLQLHIGVAVLSVAAVAALWRTQLRAVATGAFLVMAALSLDGGFRYPDLIIADALRRHADNPRCLMLGPYLRPPTSRSDLMALTMAKDRTGPSDVLLLVRYDTSPQMFRWSFRGRRFTRAPTEAGMAPLCIPHTNPIAPLP